LAHSFSKRISGTTPYYNFIRRVAFPSTRTIILTSLISTTLGIGLSFLISEGTLGSFLFGMVWGLVALTIPSFASDLVLYYTIMKKDPLFYLRRCLALSLFTTTTMVLIFLLSALIAVIDRRFIFPDFAVVVGLFAIIPPRALAVFSLSRTSFARRSVFALLEPSLTALTVILVFGLPIGRMITGLLLASTVGLAFAFALISIIESNGRKAIGFSPIRMFRAFLTDLLEGENHELESYLYELGVETEIDAAAFTFRKKGSPNFKGIILVSNFHPGPFLNVGSSPLPFLFESLMQRKFNAVALVPHGVSGHELNLVSQEQNERILDWVLSHVEKASYFGAATPVERTTNEMATATSQVFDGCALVTMTTSPLDMEDVPSELANNLSGLTHGKFRSLALIDAHNCLTGPATMTAQKVGALQEVALASLQISSEQRPTTFKVGVAHKTPTGFALKEGFGPGGISVVAIEVAGRRFAYVNVDGNNMISGLREEILGSVKGAGFDDGEVMTTDTHMVNGVVSARLGYHPIGEVVPRGPLVEEITRVCLDALNNLEDGEVGVVSGQIPVTTLGQKSLRRVMSMVYRISKLTALTLFPMVVVITVLSLLFLV
jgi:putative membrane protein